MRRLFKVLAGGAALLGVGGVVAAQAIQVSVEEYYSPGIRSQSTKEAVVRGVLLKRVRVAGRGFEWRGGRYRAREAWVEAEEQVYYRWLFVRRDSLRARAHLVVRMEGVSEDDDANLCSIHTYGRLLYDGEHELGSSSACDTWHTTISRPFPDSVRVLAVGRSPEH